MLVVVIFFIYFSFLLFCGHTGRIVFLLNTDTKGFLGGGVLAEL